MPEGKVKFTVWVDPEIAGGFRAAVATKHGTLYENMSREGEEALKLWTRIMNGQVKVPK